MRRGENDKQRYEIPEIRNDQVSQDFQLLSALRNKKSQGPAIPGVAGQGNSRSPSRKTRETNRSDRSPSLSSSSLLMTDVKDILGLGVSRPPPSSAPKPPGPGGSTSLGALAKDEQSWTKEAAATAEPPLAPSRNIKKLIQASIANKKPTTKWRLEAIHSSARPANEENSPFQHWVKVFNVPDYRFARFNKSIKFLQWSSLEEYSQACEDSQWNFQETQRLFLLCRLFDLRFLIIEDRYNSSYNPETGIIEEDSLHNPPLYRYRSVEQLKGRFYSIQQRLLLLRNSSDPDVRQHPVFIQAYEEAHETERKSEAIKLWNRPAGAAENLAEIVLEHRKIVQLLKKLKKTKTPGKANNGIKAGQKTSGAATATALAKSASTPTANKKKGATTPGPPAPVLEMAPIPECCLPVDAFPPPPSESVTLRSQQINAVLTLNPRNAKLLENEMIALNFKKPKEIIPTAPVAEIYDRLRRDAIILHNLQKYVQEREQLRDQLKAQVQPSGGAGGSLAALPSAYYGAPQSPFPMPSTPGHFDPSSASGKGFKAKTPIVLGTPKAIGLANSTGKKLDKRKSLPGESPIVGTISSGDAGNDAKRRKK